MNLKRFLWGLAFVIGGFVASLLGSGSFGEVFTGFLCGAGVVLVIQSALEN